MANVTNAELLFRFHREYQEFHQISLQRAQRQLKTLREYGAFVAPLGLLEASGAELTAYMGSLLDAGKHPNTVAFRAQLIRPFYSWAYAAQLYPVELYVRLKSASNPRGSTGRSVPRPYTPAQVRQFFRELDERYKLPEGIDLDRRISNYARGAARFGTVLRRHGTKLQIEAIVGLALHTGLRAGEIWRLSVDDVHYDNLYVAVTGAAKNRQAQPVQREVPFTPALRAAIRDWLTFRAIMRPDHAHAWLALNAWGGPLGRRLSWESMKTLLSASVAPGWELHRFRHTCATERLRSGMDLESVSKLLGHSTIQQTLAYAEIVKADVYRSIERTDDAFTRRIGRRAA